MGDEPVLMTVREAAAYLHISRDLCYEAIRRGELPAVRIGRVIRVPRFGLEQWIASQTRLPLSAPVTITFPKQQGH